MGATGPAGGVFGSAIADFGSADNGGSDAMSVVVTVAAAWVTSTSYPIVEIGPGGDHTDADDLTSEEVYALVTNIVIGVSFDIEVFAPNGTWGQWLVNWGAALTGSNDPTKASTSTTISAGDGLSGGGSLAANRSLAVDGTVVRTTRNIIAGDGMSGGGVLSADRTLAVDGTVGRTSRQILSGDGLTGGGDLSADRTLAVDSTVLRYADILSVNLGTVTTTQTVDCVGAISVSIILTLSTIGVTLNLTHLAFGVPVCIVVTNSSGTNARNLVMAATQPGGSAYGGVFWKLSTGIVNLATGIAVPIGTTMIATGSGVPTNQLLMVAN
jgi:hypothetical protein